MHLYNYIIGMHNIIGTLSEFADNGSKFKHRFGPIWKIMLIYFGYRPKLVEKYLQIGYRQNPISYISTSVVKRPGTSVPSRY